MNYASAVTTLKGKNGRKIGNNTHLERLDDETIGLRLHSTYVVKFRADGTVTLNSGGWMTVTTKDRMNYASGIRVFQKDHVWYVSILADGTFNSDNVLEFEDGMTITQ